MANFAFVGVINTCTSFIVFTIFIHFGIKYTWATLSGGLAGVLLGYTLTRRLVFSYKNHNKFFPFISLFALLCALNIYLQKLMHPFMNSYLAGAMATAICFPVSFLINKYFIFKVGQ
ncbi:GtrA family protein [Holophaga foetida]|uniref:GtrA family protein n=1 Tax=Holophaga foetida TaxID=35839 RepID=UPI003CC72F16